MRMIKTCKTHTCVQTSCTKILSTPGHFQRFKQPFTIFGAANGGIWWQITVRQIGAGHILVAIVVFQDGFWVKMNLSCEPLYGPFYAGGGRGTHVLRSRVHAGTTGLSCLALRKPYTQERAALRRAMQAARAGAAGPA